MKNTKARDNSGDDWKTPDWFYDRLNEKYHFDGEDFILNRGMIKVVL